MVRVLIAQWEWRTTGEARRTEPVLLAPKSFKLLMIVKVSGNQSGRMITQCNATDSQFQPSTTKSQGSLSFRKIRLNDDDRHANISGLYITDNARCI